MEKKIKCPKCGEEIQMDESLYTDIANQVRNQEFAQELQAREQELNKRLDAENEAWKTRAQAEMDKTISQKEQELLAKDAAIAGLEERVRGAEVEKNAAVDAAVAEGNQQIAVLQQKVDGFEQVKQSAINEALADSNKQIAVLQQKVDSFEQVKQAAVNAAVAQKNAELADMKKRANDAVISEREKQAKFISDRDLQIQKLRSDAELKAQSVELEKEKIRQAYESKLKDSQAEIDRLKDFKLRQSTKMVGESLEKHCAALYAQTLRSVLPNATFEKDNDASSGSKGDFIFREKQDGVEFASIMFEMKDQVDETKTKHKNEDFLAKLDQDRRNKGCEYAVLVSLLELDNEMYEPGIVDMSHLYPKMYVIRPQFLIPMITLIRQASLQSVEYKRELINVRNQEADLTRFEEKLNSVKDAFYRNFTLANNRFEDAIAQVDKVIAAMQKLRDFLTGAQKHLKAADGNLDDLTVRKLTYRNETVKAMIAEAEELPEEPAMPEIASLPQVTALSPTADDDLPF